MKKSFYPYFIAIAATVGMSACKKAVIEGGTTAQPSVYFIYSAYLNTADSTSFSFAVVDSTIQKDTIWMPVRISGSAADHDRPIDLAPDPATTTAVEGKHYTILPAVMPADSLSTQVGVVLFKTPDLTDTTVVIGLQIQPNSDFPGTMKDTLMADHINNSSNEYKIAFTNQLIEPSDWPDFLIYFFGNYSKVKYEFIINVTGISQFPETIDYGLLSYYLQTVQTALANYNQAHGTLYDENGNPVTIP